MRRVATSPRNALIRQHCRIPIADDNEPAYRYQVAGIIEQVKLLDQAKQEEGLNDLGIKPLWYKDHGEIPAIITEIIA